MTEERPDPEKAAGTATPGLGPLNQFSHLMYSGTLLKDAFFEALGRTHADFKATGDVCSLTKSVRLRDDFIAAQKLQQAAFDGVKEFICISRSGPWNTTTSDVDSAVKHCKTLWSEHPEVGYIVQAQVNAAALVELSFGLRGSSLPNPPSMDITHYRDLITMFCVMRGLFGRDESIKLILAKLK